MTDFGDLVQDMNGNSHDLLTREQSLEIFLYKISRAKLDEPQISWTQKDLDETLAHIREGQKQMLRAVITPLIERMKTLEAQVAELQAYDVEYRGVTELKTYSQHKRR